MSYYDLWSAPLRPGGRTAPPGGAASWPSSKKAGQQIAPVKIEGRKIARTFWGKAWCTNLERYSDYANRLPRGRSYVRNGSVVDLQITKGEITALVSGSDLYTIEIVVAPVDRARWQADLPRLFGNDRFAGRAPAGPSRQERDGADVPGGRWPVPGPKEIKMSCSCPDWAGMCKHLAATLYGVGARLDHKPRAAVRAARRRPERADRRHRRGLPASATDRVRQSSRR